MKVLILGGVGFVGRNLVKHLVDTQKDITQIKVLDKLPLALAFLSAEHKKAYENEKVTVKQANLCNPGSIAKNFEQEGGWDIVYNLAAETKYGQTEEVYKEKVLDVLKKCVAEAKKVGVKKWVEVSTAQVYKPGSKPSAEDAKLDPWTNLAKYKLAAEKELESSGVDYVVLRPAIIYGPGDTYGIAPRIIVGAVYKFLGEKLKNLWGADLAMNTVHVSDVCRAMVHASTLEKGTVYNVVDKNGTNQGKINDKLAELFSIKTGFYGKLMSQGAKAMGLKNVAETANEKHLKPWSDLCKKQGVASTPLSPYIDPELIKNTAFSVDGSAIEKSGFKYEHPTMTMAHYQEIMNYFVDQGLFPKIEK